MRKNKKRDRKIERERERERKTESYKGTEKETERDREKDRERDTEREKWIAVKMDRNKEINGKIKECKRGIFIKAKKSKNRHAMNGKSLNFFYNN